MLGVFFDSEANGLNIYVHKILEVAFKIVDLRSGTLKAEYQSIIAQPLEAWKRSDPVSLQITGFGLHDIQSGHPPALVAQQILDLLMHWQIQRGEAVFICQNPSFDRSFFSQLIDAETQELFNLPYHWLDLASMFWALFSDQAKRLKTPYPWEIGLSKDLIAAYYKLPLEEKPHRAMNGVNHLLLCYKAVVGFPEHK